MPGGEGCITPTRLASLDLPQGAQVCFGRSTGNPEHSTSIDEFRANATSRTLVIGNDKRVLGSDLVSRYEPTYSSCECDSPCSSLDLAKSPGILCAKRRLYSKNMAVRQATIMPKARMKNNPAVCCTEMILPT
jgi:hypothetical protein